MSKKNTPKDLDPIRDPALIAKLCNNVMIKDDCWIWLMYKDKKGYGQIRYKEKVLWAHRVSYAIFCDNLSNGDSIHHTCHNPSCVNPDHLTTLSLSDNSKERWSRHETS